MKLKKGLLLSKTEGRYYLLDPGTNGKRFNGMVQLNETGSFVIKQLQSGDVTVEDIVQAMCAEYDTTAEIVRPGITRTVSLLQENGLLETDEC